METKVLTTKGGFEVNEDKQWEFVNLGIDLPYDGKVFKSKESPVSGDIEMPEKITVGTVGTPIPVVELIRIPVSPELAQEFREKYNIDESNEIVVDLLSTYPGKIIPLGYGFVKENGEARYFEDLRGKNWYEIEIDKGNIDPDDIKEAINEFLADEEYVNDEDLKPLTELFRKVIADGKLSEEELMEIKKTIDQLKADGVKFDKWFKKAFKTETEWKIGKKLNGNELKKGQRLVLNGIITGIDKEGNVFIVYIPSKVDFKVSKSQFAKILNNHPEYGERFKALQYFAVKTPWKLLKEKDEVIKRINKALEKADDKLLKGLKKALVEAKEPNKESIEKIKKYLDAIKKERFEIIKAVAKEENLIDVDKLLAKGKDGYLFLRNPLHSEGMPVMTRKEFNNIEAINMVAVPRVVKDVSSNRFVIQPSFFPVAVKSGNKYYGSKPTIPYSVYRTLKGIVKNIEEGNLKGVKTLIGRGFKKLPGIDELKKQLSKRETQYAEWLSQIQKELADIVFDKSLDEPQILEKAKEYINDSEVGRFVNEMENFFSNYLNGGFFNVKEFRQKLENASGRKIRNLSDTKGLDRDEDVIKAMDMPEKTYRANLRKLRSTIIAVSDLNKTAETVKQLKEAFDKLREEGVYKYTSEKMYGVHNALYYNGNLRENTYLRAEPEQLFLQVRFEVAEEPQKPEPEKTKQKAEQKSHTQEAKKRPAKKQKATKQKETPKETTKPKKEEMPAQIQDISPSDIEEIGEEIGDFADLLNVDVGDISINTEDLDNVKTAYDEPAITM